MKKTTLTILLTAVLLLQPVAAQVVIDCSNCSGADWSREWSPSQNACTYNPTKGCGNGCNCHMGFSIGYGTAIGTPPFFGGAFTRDGFRVDRPGPLTVFRVVPGDVIYRINGRRPTRAMMGTPKRPIKRITATWDAQQHLRLRFWR